MSNEIVLKLTNVSKSFVRIETEDVTSAVDGINLEMRSGEFVSIVGKSGCGKSTILRMIAGLISPTTGKITIDDKEITDSGPDRGMVFQKATLFPWLTVEKNIYFSLRMKGNYRQKQGEVDRMLKMIGLEEFKDDYPGQLSGGMTQRVALVRSLINEPNILLLDEPLGALDAFTRMNMQDEILDLWQKKKQLAIMVTHDIDEAIYMGTKVLIMESTPGRIKATLPIELDFPRNRSSSSFVEYRKQILDTLGYNAKE